MTKPATIDLEHLATVTGGVIPLSTQTYMNSSGRVAIAPSPQSSAFGFSPVNGSRTANGFTVFNNNGGAGTAMSSSGRISAGRFDIQPSTGRSVFIPSYR